MEPEVYFLRYAFPCSHILRTLRKEIGEEDYEKMKLATVNEVVLPRDYLERVFHRAFERMGKIAHELGKDRWDRDVIEEYFVKRHNAFVDASENPEQFKDQCRVHIAEIKEITGGEMVVAYGSGKSRKVRRDYVPGVSVGDKVTIHYSYAVEKVE